MKKNILNWMTIALMAFVCVGFAACGGDDDDDDRGGSGGGTAKVNGQTYNFVNGYWDAGSNNTTFEFANCDITSKNPASYPSRIDMLCFTIRGITSPQPGTYETTIELYSFAPTADREIHYPGGGGRVSVTIAKSGDKYTFTIPETNVNYYSNGDGKNGISVPFSFSWTGTLMNFDFSE